MEFPQKYELLAFDKKLGDLKGLPLNSCFLLGSEHRSGLTNEEEPGSRGWPRWLVFEMLRWAHKLAPECLE